MFEGFETKVVDVDGIAIACVVGGAGLPVLLLHGFPLPSPKPTRLLQLFVPRLCADQLGLMRWLGFPRFHVIGHDRGGRTAHRLALDHPDCDGHRFNLCDVHGYQSQPRRRLLALVFPGATRAVSRAPDWQRSRLLLRDLPRRMGATRIDDFDPEMLVGYRAAWRILR